MPNNPYLRRAGVTTVPAANKLVRGAALATDTSSSESTLQPRQDTSVVAPPGSVTSVNGYTGAVSLTYSDVGADAAGSAAAAQAAAIAAAATDATTKANAAQAAAIAASLQKSANLSDVASKITSKANLNIIAVNVRDYGATGDGSTDDTAAIKAAIEAVSPTGGIDRVIITNRGTGYTSAPTVSFTGHTGSAIAATALVADAGASGEIGSIVFSNRGTGIVVKGKQVGVTSGSATITCSDTSGLVNGMAADCEVFAPGSTIVSFVPNVSITLSANAVATRAFAQAAFGIPRLVLTGGGGSGADGDVIVGESKILLFPPGTYWTNQGFDFTGKHNLVVIGHGATVFVAATNPSGCIVEEFSRDITFHGLRVEHVSAVFGNSATRDPGCGWRIGGSLISLIDCEAYSSAEFGVLFGRDRTTGTALYGCRLINFRAIQTCGDGIHASNGCGGLQIINPRCISCGDDCIGIVSDYGAGNQVSNVVINGYHLEGGGWRGIAIAGAINVQVGPGIIQDVEGHGIETEAASGANNEKISLSGFHILRCGQGGAGAPVGTRSGIVAQYVTGLKIGPGFIDTVDSYGLFADNITDGQIDPIMVLNAGTAPYSLGGTLTRVTQLYNDSGALKYRGSAGTVTTVAAA